MRPKKVILCVDDNETTLSVRTFLLETRGYRVLTATTARAALEVLEQTVPGTLDLLIADLLLPGMDGNELVRRAKQMHPTPAYADRVRNGGELRPGVGSGCLPAQECEFSGGVAGTDSGAGGSQTRAQKACPAGRRG